MNGLTKFALLGLQVHGPANIDIIDIDINFDAR